MDFKVLEKIRAIPSAKNKCYLIADNWNDYSYYTLYELFYYDQLSERHRVGQVKIGFRGQETGKSTFRIGESFEHLDDDFFSLGQSDFYYEKLNKLGDAIRDEILKRLRDVAKDASTYDLAIEENVTKTSLLRYISPTSVVGQFRRMCFGGARLTEYSFYFNPPQKGSSTKNNLFFRVEPDSFPPTNIHVIIGRNGVGKTHLMNNMISSLTEQKGNYGEFISELKKNDQIFANLVSVSFSAFDDFEPQPEVKDKLSAIHFSYIGLKRLQTGPDKIFEPKSTVMLKNEFIKSLKFIRSNAKIELWLNAIHRLESDSNFKEAEVANLIYEHADHFEETAAIIFKRLSSGHKIVLLTITRLIETMQEKTLVLIDEPEAHLHPPLLSAFIRSLSELLINKNGVGIIATHSPVILQEVPKSCVWKLRRVGSESTLERLQIESFGENVGILTGEVFGLEVTESGFYQLLKEQVGEDQDYKSILRNSNEELGSEARAILRALLLDKNSNQ